MIIYVISPIYYDYDDNNNFGGESLCDPEYAFFNLEKAEKILKEKEKNEFFDYLLKYFYSFQDPFDFNDEDLQIIRKELKIEDCSEENIADAIHDIGEENLSKDFIDFLLNRFNYSFYQLTEVEMCDTFA